MSNSEVKKIYDQICIERKTKYSPPSWLMDIIDETAQRYVIEIIHNLKEHNKSENNIYNFKVIPDE
jgi:hypothetical protein